MNSGKAQGQFYWSLQGEKKRVDKDFGSCQDELREGKRWNFVFWARVNIADKVSGGTVWAIWQQGHSL